MNKNLRILHLNIRSIQPESKILELTRIAKINKIDIISLNETYLKPDKTFELPGFKIFRADRLDRRGGGAAICIKDNLISSEIFLGHISNLDNATGCELTIDHNYKLAIFLIYSSPSNKIINENLLYYITENYNNFIITGDLNAKNKIWHCNKENQSGNLVEEFVNKKNCHILNCNKPTYPSSKNILDLSICSNSILKFFKSHRVLNCSISDHQPTITEFVDMSPKLRTFSYNKINWNKFKTNIVENLPEVDLNSIEDIETETSKIIDDIVDSIKNASTRITFGCKAITPIVIPKHLVELIKLKRIINRKLKKIKNDYTTRIYNMLCYKVKKEVRAFKSNKLKEEFLELENFNQSESKCWKLLNKLENPNMSNEKNQKIELKKSDNSTTRDENEIANMFSNNLAEIFKPETHTFVYEDNLELPLPITNPDPI